MIPWPWLIAAYAAGTLFGLIIMACLAVFLAWLLGRRRENQT